MSTISTTQLDILQQAHVSGCGDLPIDARAVCGAAHGMPHTIFPTPRSLMNPSQVALQTSTAQHFSVATYSSMNHVQPNASSTPNTRTIPIPSQPRFFHTRFEDLPEIPDVPMLVEDLIPGGALTILVAPSGLGKTRVALQLANAVANGLPFHGRTVKQCKVLHFDNEMGARLVHRYGKAIGLHGYVDFIYDAEFANIVNIIQDAVKAGCGFVVIDSYASMANQTGIENAVNSNSVAEMVLKPLSDLAHSTGISILVLHHTNKGNIQFDGSQRIRGLADCMATLSLNRRTKELELNQNKIRFEFEALSWDAADHPLLKGKPGTSEAEESDKELEWVLERLMNGQVSKNDIVEAYQAEFGKSEKSLTRKLEEAVTLGLVRMEKSGRKNVYSLVTPGMAAAA